jgi:hypothetical protein
MALTIYRLAEQTLRIINGGELQNAVQPTLPQVKLLLGQVINQLLKVGMFEVNMADGERIPNGLVVGTYENIAVTTYNGKSRAELPIKPQHLPRNMGVFGVYPRWNDNEDYRFDEEFIPLQMGQGGLLKSQRLLNDLLGQIGYENFGGYLVFTKDLKSIDKDVKLAMRLVIMDISQYGDYDILPLPPEYEFQAINAVVQMFVQSPVPDKLVDPSVAEQKNIPIPQQRMS